MTDFPPILTGSGLRYAYDPSVSRPRPVSPTYDPFLPCAPPPRIVSPAYDKSAPFAAPRSRPPSPKYDPTPDPVPPPPLASLPERPRGVGRVQFTVRTPEEIVKLSAVRVTTSLITQDGVAVKGGLRDPRFGPSAGCPCGTCFATHTRPCNGHFGHYGPLSEPLYNIHFVKQVVVWLRVVCGACGELQVDALPAGKEHLGVLSLTSWREKKCRKCQESLLQSMAWSRDKQVIVLRSGDVLHASEALRRFRLVPDDHPFFESFKMPHPRALLTTVLFVPSVCLRPCVGGKGKEEAPRGENDLTYRIVKIIHADTLLCKKKQTHSRDPISLRAALLGLQEAYTGYLDASKTSKSASAADHGHQPKYKDLAASLRGKDGLFRGNLCGKRVDFCARGVITPAFDNTHPTMVGVPKWVCQSMTVPETVTRYNQAHLQEIVREKRAKYLERNGERVNLETHSDPGRLQIGWVVHRELRQNDVVLFNRQPTLSKRSVLALRVNELDTNLRVFRLPLQLTPGFNADFDGDEMNLHVPQSIEARAECYSLLGVHNSVINSSDGRASVVPVQGDRLGTYLMTDKTRELTRKQWFAALCKCTDFMVRRAAKDPPGAFPVRASRLWSLSLPEGYNWTDINGKVVVRRGYVVRGQLTKKLLLLLVKDMALDLSPSAALDFLHNVNAACGAYNGHVAPTTITFDEVCPSAQLAEKCRVAMDRAHLQSKRPGADVSECIAQATRAVSAHVYAEQNRMPNKGMQNLVDSGSKGNPVNACMMLGCLGKMRPVESVEGVFTPPEDNPDGDRRCFSTSDGIDLFRDTYVSSGYSKGMNLQQYAVHGSAGRTSLIASSQLVGKVGYMFRRLTTTLESCSCVMGSVVDASSNCIICFRYGDDGRSPFVVERERMIVPKCRSGAPGSEALDAEVRRHVDAILELYPDARERVFDVPVSVRRVLHDAANRDYDESELVVCESVEDVARRHAEYARAPFIGHWIQLHLHPYATSHLTDRARAWAVAEVDRRMWKSRLDDGEPVGSLCASAISAAATQFTLNSFHNIGGSGGSYAALNESIDLNKTRKTPKTQFKLNPCAGNIVDWVETHRLVTLRDVMLERGAPKPGDDDVLRAYWEFPDEPGQQPFTPCMRLEVHHHDIFAVRLALRDAGVKHAAYAYRDNGVVVFHTDTTVTTTALNTVVSGSIEGCWCEGSTVYCKRMPNLEDFIDDVDLCTYYTNNFHKTRQTLGIEAARATMVQEIKLLLKTFGVSMQSRHVELVADRCCREGELLGCTRHGMQKRDPKRILHSSAFEQHTHVLSVAAAAGGVDGLSGPQERQVMGQTAKIGTRNPWLELRADPMAIPVDQATPEDSMRVDDEDELDFADGWFMPQQVPDEAQNALQQDPWAVRAY